MSQQTAKSARTRGRLSWEAPLARIVQSRSGPLPDLSTPPGESGLVEPDSVSWRVFKNPVSLFVGGVAAVLLELAEPRVRSGVWDFTSFRTDPMARMQRTGAAAMLTVYGARSMAEKRIAGVRRMHDGVAGITPDGIAYRANDPHLLNWVHATAAYGFLEAYDQFVRPVSPQDRDRYWAEGQTAAGLYGADAPPVSQAEWENRLARMLPELEPSAIVFDFLAILQAAPIFPRLFRPCQHSMIRAAVTMTPSAVRDRLGLDATWDLSPRERRWICRGGLWSDRVFLTSSPPAQACMRMGLPANYLYRSAV